MGKPVIEQTSKIKIISNPRMIKKYDIVVAKLDISEEITEGTQGVILTVYDNGSFS